MIFKRIGADITWKISAASSKTLSDSTDGVSCVPLGADSIYVEV